MGNYEQLKQSVSDVIKTNGNKEITGSILQNVLLTIISTVGANATFAGIATPTTNPGTPDGSVFWIASESGTYSNFGSIELQDGLSILMWNGSWRSQQIFGVDDVPTSGSDNLVKSGGVYTKIKALEDAGYIFAGIATPTTNPGTPDGSVFYLASESGTYTNFNAIELQDGLSVLMWNGSWRSQQIFSIDDVPTAGSTNPVSSGGVQEEFALGAVYDVSAKNPTGGSNNDGKWESLSALLSDANLNTLIPTIVRKGGMSIKFIQSSDNKYIQARFMLSDSFTDAQFATPANWQRVDNVLIAGSGNLVKSGAIFEKLFCNEPSFTLDESNSYITASGDYSVLNNYSTYKLSGFLKTGTIQLTFYFAGDVPIAILFDKDGNILDVLYTTSAPGGAYRTVTIDTDSYPLLDYVIFNTYQYSTHNPVDLSALKFRYNYNVFDNTPLLNSNLLVKSENIRKAIAQTTDISLFQESFDKYGSNVKEPILHTSGKFLLWDGSVRSDHNYDIYKVVFDKMCPLYRIQSKVYTGSSLPICICYDENDNIVNIYGDAYMANRSIDRSGVQDCNEIYIPNDGTISYVLVTTFSNDMPSYGVSAESIGYFRNENFYIKNGYYADSVNNYKYVDNDAFRATPIISASGISSIIFKKSYNSVYITNFVGYDKNFNVVKDIAVNGQVGEIKLNLDNSGISYISLCELAENEQTCIFRKKTKWRGKHIAILGDSITAQKYVTNALQASEGCIIENYGVGGTTITLDGNPATPNQDFCRRFEGAFTTAYNDGMQVDLFIMWGGVNDFAAKDTLGDISQANNQATFYASLHRLANDQLNLLKDTPIVWVTPMHTNYNSNTHKDWVISNGVFSYKNNDNQYLYTFANAIKEVASIYGIPVLDMYSIGPVPQKQPELFLDGLHPNDKGAAVIAEQIHNFIQNI